MIQGVFVYLFHFKTQQSFSQIEQAFGVLDSMHQMVEKLILKEVGLIRAFFSSLLYHKEPDE